jgi:hypothetical protein
MNDVPIAHNLNQMASGNPRAGQLDETTVSFRTLQRIMENR